MLDPDTDIHNVSASRFKAEENLVINLRKPVKQKANHEYCTERCTIARLKTRTINKSLRLYPYISLPGKRTVDVIHNMSFIKRHLGGSP
ncbi:hypothetical protein PoB_005647900 [Plakobranchus ocellatus]|uniref:Uncharacterized protein n=1 Tax=Plakobranchus ocellatus TaxID=259542 RepID=A0AAV4CBL7_9GAST|nr:hypothetical protein PoB_005647900 [Plakobranchus ocellatus]